MTNYMRYSLRVIALISAASAFSLGPPPCHFRQRKSSALCAPSRRFGRGSVVRYVAVAPAIQTTFQSSGVQKVLELAVVAGAGAALRDNLDAKSLTALLLNALVPAVIISSLSTLKFSAEMGLVFLSGVTLALIQLASGELASRFVIPMGKDNKASNTLRRTAALQLGTMAPALSVFSFTREFVGESFAGLAALADVPTKLYTLLLIPYYLRFRGSKRTDVRSDVLDEANAKNASWVKRLSGVFSDPFNLAISGGLLLAAFGRPVSTLGFLGSAIGGLAQAQTAILFLLIGLKLKFGGDSPKLCLRLLLARHGFCSLAVSAFLALLMGKAGSEVRLAAVLSSHAACSIIAFGQMSKVSDSGIGGYETDLAFDIVALSFPFTVMLNTVACLVGNTYVDFLPFVGAAFLAMSALLGR